MIQNIKDAFKYLMETAHANSRLVYLAHGLAVAAGTLVIAIGFVFTTVDKQTNYAEVILALSAGGGAASAGRYLTKKANAPTDPSKPEA